jgi:hypothetical protein
MPKLNRKTAHLTEQLTKEIIGKRIRPVAIKLLAKWDTVRSPVQAQTPNAKSRGVISREYMVHVALNHGTLLAMVLMYMKVLVRTDTFINLRIDDLAIASFGDISKHTVQL